VGQVRRPARFGETYAQQDLRRQADAAARNEGSGTYSPAAIVPAYGWCLGGGDRGQGQPVAEGFDARPTPKHSTYSPFSDGLAYLSQAVWSKFLLTSGLATIFPELVCADRLYSGQPRGSARRSRPVPGGLLGPRAYGFRQEFS